MKDLNELNKACEAALDQLFEGLGKGTLSTEDLDGLCASHPDCEQVIRESYHLWQEMDAMTVPEPSENMRGAFMEMLSSFEKEEKKEPKALVIRLSWKSSLKWAAVFVVGLSIGLLLRTMPAGDASGPAQRSDVSLLLTSDNAPTERLLAIQRIKEIPNPEDPVIEALHQTLMKDPNVNVRLSAIEAMVHFIEHPKARTSLVSALPYQDSPIVQLTLAELLISLQSEQSIDELKMLLNSDELDHDVKLHLQETLNL